MSKIHAQVAALPLRWNSKGRLRILLITSRDTGRWVLPKGWPMDGKKPWRAAEIEALEEAGVEGYIAKEALGTYQYDKVLENDVTVRCNVELFPMIVDKVKKRWKERDERKRRWFSASGAVEAVNEPELMTLLAVLEERPKKQPIIRDLLRAA